MAKIILPMKIDMRKKVLKILIAFGGFSILFGSLAFAYKQVFFLAIPVAGVVTGIALMSLSCPNCGFSVLYRQQKAFGVKFMAFTFWPPKNCPNCGQRL